DQKSGQRAAFSFFRAQITHRGHGGNDRMRPDGRSTDRVGAYSVLIQQVEHSVSREKSTLRIESCRLAVKVVVALLPGRELHFSPHDRLALEHIFQTLLVIAGQIHSPRLVSVATLP